MTGVPAHTVDDGNAAILRLTGSVVTVFIVIGFELAGLPIAQEFDDIMMQFTTSPLLGTMVKTELLLPVFDPFNCH